MNINRKRTAFFLLLVFISIVLIPLSSPTVKGKETKKTVYWIPVEKTVEQGLYEFLNRSLTEAENSRAEHIVLEVNTPGGVVEAATDITKRLADTSVPVTAFINNRALSAGAYISLHADQIVMVPGASMGAAAIIDQEGNTAGKKAKSYWLKEMQNSAELHGRDPIYALAMADEAIDLPEYNAEKGELLTLSASDAVKVGYAEKIVKDRKELLTYLNLNDAKVITMQETLAEKIARFITHPVVVPILLSIGSLGLVLELYTPGFGVPGLMGLISLFLFFYGHMVAGLAGMESVLLLIAGIVLLVLEIFVPGGILGVIGGVFILVSLFMATEDAGHMLLSLLIAISVTIAGSVFYIKSFGVKSKLFSRLILTDATSTDKGYISNQNRNELIGLEGVTVTPLRPAGLGMFNQEKIDIVSEGDYIEAGIRVKVIKVSGARIVVRKLTDS